MSSTDGRVQASSAPAGAHLTTAAASLGSMGGYEERRGCVGQWPHSIRESRSPSAPLAGRELDKDAAAREDRSSRARGAREERERHGVWGEDGDGDVGGRRGGDLGFELLILYHGRAIRAIGSVMDGYN